MPGWHRLRRLTTVPSSTFKAASRIVVLLCSES